MVYIHSVKRILFYLLKYCMADSLQVFLVDTLCFAILWVIASVLLSRYVRNNTEDARDKPLYGRMTIYFVTMAVVLMYIMWLCSFLHQLNPLLIPDMEKGIAKELLDSEREDLIKGNA